MPEPGRAGPPDLGLSLDGLMDLERYPIRPATAGAAHLVTRSRRTLLHDGAVSFPVS